jgi:pilus assembly protein Flp/PilA
MLILRKFWACESGATAVEYGLIVTVFTAAILGGYAAFSDALNNRFSSLANGPLK